MKLDVLSAQWQYERRTRVQKPKPRIKSRDQLDLEIQQCFKNVCRANTAGKLKFCVR